MTLGCLTEMQVVWKLQARKIPRYGRNQFSNHRKLSTFRRLSPVLDLLSRPRGSVVDSYFQRPYSSNQQPEASYGIGTENSIDRRPPRVSIPIDGKTAEFSALLLRDSCACPLCVHESTKQRLFSTAEIPADFEARTVEVDPSSNLVKITWNRDVPGHDQEHMTELSMEALRSIMHSGQAPGSLSDSFLPPVLWSKEPLNLPDYDYEAYMKDDKTLYQLILQLRTEGLAFVTNVPGLEESLATIATRIGPVKDTFYGHTWDVRTVPAAINAAYTSHDLGFHTDLLYFQHPPHVQLLHCIQSASSGGASVFADAFRAAVDLFHTDIDAFNTLATVPVNYHYNHPNANVYHTTKAVIDLCPLRLNDVVYTHFNDYLNAIKSRHTQSWDSNWKTSMLVQCLQKINWGPPFLAPFSNHKDPVNWDTSSLPALSELNNKIDEWHWAASKFNALLQRPEYLFERKMKPGECVLFDNTRTLHSRRSFDMADVGKPRWLRGTYVDKDPYLSKLRVLQNRFR